MKKQKRRWSSESESEEEDDNEEEQNILRNLLLYSSSGGNRKNNIIKPILPKYAFSPLSLLPNMIPYEEKVEEMEEYYIETYSPINVTNKVSLDHNLQTQMNKHKTYINSSSQQIPMEMGKYCETTDKSIDEEVENKIVLNPVLGDLTTT